MRLLTNSDALGFPSCGSLGTSLAAGQTYSDPSLRFFLSGRAHVWYAALGIIVFSIAILLGASYWLLLGNLILASGIFVDVWVHQYAH